MRVLTRVDAISYREGLIHSSGCPLLARIRVRRAIAVSDLPVHALNARSIWQRLSRHRLLVPLIEPHARAGDERHRYCHDCRVRP